jgi:hypothetical protein
MSQGEEEAEAAKGIGVVALVTMGNIPTNILEAKVGSASRTILHKHVTLQPTPKLSHQLNSFDNYLKQALTSGTHLKTFLLHKQETSQEVGLKL